MKPRTIWTPAQLQDDLNTAKEDFRRERLEEPLEAYYDAYEKARDAVDDLLEKTIDLSRIEEEIIDILIDGALKEGFRYLAGPPISVDDLKTLIDTTSLSPKILRANPELVGKLAETIMATLDRRRFPWVREGREPTDAEKEAAAIATTALIATQKVATRRRNEGKRAQEDLVRQALLDYGMTKVVIPRNQISTIAHAPQAGRFCGETTLVGRKADFVVRLWDGRIMAIECKVSNSSLNSVKRLNNDAAAKAVHWERGLGTSNVVPTAVLSGVYKLQNLISAQDVGLTLYWAHRVTDLIEWIESTRTN